MARNPDLPAQLIAGYQQAAITAKQIAMLDYAVKLTLEPGNMVEADIVLLRETGFTDRDILDINQVAAYYAYVNRTADGLGVSLETQKGSTD